MFVISANYRDRTSPYPWLVRRFSEPVEKAKAYKTVRAKGVRFQPSNKSEQGFGCTTVAVAKSVELGLPEKQEVALRFDGLGFVERETGADVDACDILTLSADRSMVATM